MHHSTFVEVSDELNAIRRSANEAAARLRGERFPAEPEADGIAAAGLVCEQELAQGIEWESGGLMSNSPPSNVKLAPDEAVRVLASGLDTAVLTMDVEWQSEAVFEPLAAAKSSAKSSPDEPVVVTWACDGWTPEMAKDRRIILQMLPYGAGGYEYVLQGREYTFRLAESVKSNGRPNVLVELRSELLWRCGPGEGVSRIIDVISQLGGIVRSVKASRLDVCCDVLISEDDWMAIKDAHRVSRAASVSTHEWRRKFTGLSLGRGMISARLYDKPLEIRQQSNKFWMYDIWQCNKPADGYRIIRVEFQLRREALRELGVDEWPDWFNKRDAVWAYLTQRWLRVVDDADLHHNCQAVLPWWAAVQSVPLVQKEASPAVRVRAEKADERQLLQQIGGCVAAISALRSESSWGLREALGYCQEQLMVDQFGDTSCRLAAQEKMPRLFRGELRLDRGWSREEEADRVSSQDLADAFGWQ